MTLSYIIIALMVFVGLSATSSVTWARENTGILDLDLRQNRYLGEPQSSSQSHNYTFLSGDLNLESHSSSVDFKFNPIAEGAFESPNEFYFGVPEFYVQPKNLSPGFSLAIGRQKRHWSLLDEEFNLGVWQPQLRWDYLQPRQQGLIGVFFDWTLSSQLHLTVMTSPVFLPDQGPNFLLQGGKFKSGNRWFSPPQSRVALFQGTPFAKDAPLYFELDRPAEEQIIMHPTLGFSLQYQSDSVWWANFNYAYLPRNQIHLGIECTNCARVGGTVPLEITAVIHPVIVMHNVATIETGFTRQEDRGWLSLSYDKSNSSGLPADYEEAPLDSMMIAGASYQHFIPASFLPPSWLKFSYMQTIVVRKMDVLGLIDSDQVQSSLDRYPFSEVAAVEWSLLLRKLGAGSFRYSTRYAYSVPEKGGWLELAADYTLNDFTYMLGADVLGADVDAASSNAGLFSRYRANDRVFGGVSYVF